MQSAGLENERGAERMRDPCPLVPRSAPERKRGDRRRHRGRVCI